MQRTGLYEVRNIDDSWNDEMLAIAERSPVVAGGLSVVFDQRPDVFRLPRLRSKELSCAGFFVHDDLHGFAMMLTREAFVDGVPNSVLYFCNLHADDAARGAGFLYRSSDVLLAGPAHAASLGQAVFLRDNRAAARLINRFHPQYPNMPYSKVVGQWEARCIILSPDPLLKPRHATRPARMDDIDAIAGLLRKEHSRRLFGSVVSRETILDDLARLPDFGIENFIVAEHRDEIVGVCCAWDLTAVKRNRVIEYGPRFRRFLVLYRLFGPALGLPPLPDAGNPFRDVTIVDYGVEDRNPAILRSLLVHTYREYRKRGYHLLLFGASAGDPLAAAVRRFPGQSLVSNVVAFSRSRSIVDRIRLPAMPWVDMALL